MTTTTTTEYRPLRVDIVYKRRGAEWDVTITTSYPDSVASALPSVAWLMKVYVDTGLLFPEARHGLERTYTVYVIAGDEIGIDCFAQPGHEFGPRARIAVSGKGLETIYNFPDIPIDLQVRRVEEKDVSQLLAG